MLLDKLKCDAPECSAEFDRPKGAEKYQKHTCTSQCLANLIMSVLKECQREMSITFAPLYNGNDVYGLNLPINSLEKEKGDIS